MVEILLVLTLVAGISTVGLLALLVLRARTAEREAREELSRSLATFSQTLTAQMGSSATVQNAQFETLRGAVEQQLGRIQQDNPASSSRCARPVDENLHATLEKRPSESFKQVSDRPRARAQGLRAMQTLAAGGRPQARAVQREDARRFGETQPLAARAGDGAGAIREERSDPAWLARARGVRDQAARQW
jgi:hypothetical protein